MELELQVAVSQVSVSQRDTVLRQLAALLHILDNDIHLRALQGHSHLRCTSLRQVAYTSGSQTWGRDPNWGLQIILWGPQMTSLIFLSLSYK